MMGDARARPSNRVASEKNALLAPRRGQFRSGSGGVKVSLLLIRVSELVFSVPRRDATLQQSNIHSRILSRISRILSDKRILMQPVVFFAREVLHFPLLITTLFPVSGRLFALHTVVNNRKGEGVKKERTVTNEQRTRRAR